METKKKLSSTEVLAISEVIIKEATAKRDAFVKKEVAELFPILRRKGQDLINQLKKII